MEVRAFRLRGTGFRRALEYGGRWSVKSRITSDGLELQLAPSDLDESIYVAVPETAPLSWRVRVIAAAGSTHERLTTPKGAFLLYSGSHYRPTVRLQLPPTRGLHTIQVLAPVGDRLLAETRVVLRKPE